MTDINTLDSAVVRFAGDSGDGMQIIGNQMAVASSILGNDVHTFPDFPAEIRAPSGTLNGVSGFQLCFSDKKLYTHGDKVDTLIAMNPAALVANLDDVKKNGIILLNSDKFTEKEFKKAKASIEVLDTLSEYTVVHVPMTKLVKDCLEDSDLPFSKKVKCKNMFALGVVYWLYERDLKTTDDWFQEKFGKNKSLLEANKKVFHAGYDYALNVELLPRHFVVKKAKLEPGTYKQVTGNQAISFGCASVAALEDKGLFVAGYPITPASDILHYLVPHNASGVEVFQAEDEIAAVCACIGASFGGRVSATFTSGPGFDLKAEGLGLAFMAELPLVVVNVQRAGPSTGMPTKPEQSDLLQAMYGRHGENNIPVFAPISPADNFDVIRKAFKVAVKYMTPVIVLSDAFLANSSEAWKIPDIDSLEVLKREEVPKDYAPYLRNSNLARYWVTPGLKGYEHCIGGLAKEDITGNVSYDPENHQKMIKIRHKKVENISDEYPETEVFGDSKGDTLLVTWGSSFGASFSAYKDLKNRGKNISLLAIHYINPLPKDLEKIFKNFKSIVVVELNQGQLVKILRQKYEFNFLQFNKTTGKPFKVAEIFNEFIEK